SWDITEIPRNAKKILKTFTSTTNILRAGGLGDKMLKALYGNANNRNHGGNASNDGNPNSNYNKVTVAKGGGLGVSSVAASLPAVAPLSTREIVSTAAATVSLKATTPPP
ncbi:hypothetical protein KI387_032228, partial [Taxus chinensis]